MEAYFAGGCFWCMAKPYHTIKGVLQVESGYCGGSEENPTYAQVKSQKTSHRETVRILYDPAEISFAELLDIYFYNIDPFDDGGQFIDRGHSYTCAVYCTDAEQRAAAEEAIARIEAQQGRRVCVSVEDFRRFYRAEEYHQDYAQKHAEAYQREYETSGRAERPEDMRIHLLDP